MDQATQQNAALVEEMAAAASSLKGQAQDLVQAVAVFKLAQGHGAAAAQPKPGSSPSKVALPKPVVTKPTPKAAPAASVAAAAPARPVSVKAADAGDDWETF
jgi:methyl-accepting chemotaxis protein